MIAVDGADVRAPLELDADVVIVGSGPSGSAFARELARAGARVVVLEEGGPVTSMPPDPFTAMAATYRGMGAQLTRGRAPMPLVQGRAVGGTSVINGAISWRLPRDVHDAWAAADPALGDAWAWDALEAVTDELVDRLGIAPTDPAIAGRHNQLLAAGAEALGVAHRPIARNVVGCRGSGRCMAGCPHGAKRSMDRTLLADAVADGARVVAHVRVERVVVAGERAVGVVGRADGGGRVTVRAGRVVLAASALQTPVLLLRSGIRHGPVGRHFRAHPGAGVLGRFPDPVRCWEGATQGHEVIGWRREGIKLEALGMHPGVLVARLPGFGVDWAAEAARVDHVASVGVALKAVAEGVVTAGWGGAPVVRYDLADDDVRTLARGIAGAGRVLFAAGAVEVLPGVRGFDTRVADPRRLDALEADPPRDPTAYSCVATHLFGTCRAASDPARGVVRPDLRHHVVDGLVVADSSVFPTNTGVNPQTSILAVATLAARRLAA